MFRFVPATGESVDGAGEGIRTPDLLITNQLLYQTELRQPRQKVNFSTSYATLQLQGGHCYGRREGPADDGAATPYCTRFARRWRTASNRAMPVATDTFKL